ncbi:Fic/DOC family protein [Candidatus Izimaplasma bacterium HR1]|jgi:Fic family protein|nr:Fic/DOC family protein [Candidatus Izimaplasma bacterium HR1]
MKYIGTKEISKKWGINDRRVRILCEEGRIESAMKVGKSWLIREDEGKPYDARRKSNKEYIGLESDFSNIDLLKKEIDSYRPLPKRISKGLHEKLIVEWTYNSNAIEGNTLTMSETKVVLEGITIGGKSVIEHLETINHKDAILFLEELISGNEEISEWNIKNVHSLILKDIDNKNAGKYRNENVIISGASHIPPNHVVLQELMQKLIIEYNKEWNEFHPVIKACLLHGEFVKIHPFIDGNGRTARLILNFELMKYGYTPIIITKTKRAEYYDTLDYAHTTMDYSKFIKLVSEFVVESEMLWLKVIR